jgi:hypothetical protein
MVMMDMGHLLVPLEDIEKRIGVDAETDLTKRVDGIQGVGGS